MIKNPKKILLFARIILNLQQILLVMNIRYITEKDFVPRSISHAERHNDVEDGLFRIVYGVMQDVMNNDLIYDLIVRLSKEQKSETVKRFVLLAWKKEVETILTKLQKLDVNDFRVVVVIPFTNYVENVPHTISRFQLVLFTINEILEKGDTQMETLPEHLFIMNAKSIRELLGEYYVRYMDAMLPEEIKDKRPYYRNLFFDEMLRRGMTKFRSDEVFEDPDTHEITSQELVILKPSQYFNQPERFFDIMEYSGVEEWKKLKIKSELEELDDSDNTSGSKNTSREKDYKLGAVGTVFFMLQDLSQEAVDKKNKKKLVALANYILDNEPENDTPRSYVDKLLGITAKNRSFKFYDRVRTNLRRFKFQVPKVIREGYENSRK